MLSTHPLVFPAAEKVSSLGKDWHKFCLKCERCNKTLTPGGHAEVRAAGVDWLGNLNCHAEVTCWALQHPRDRESQELDRGRYPVLCRWAKPRSTHCGFRCCCRCNPWYSGALVHSPGQATEWCWHYVLVL